MMRRLFYLALSAMVLTACSDDEPNQTQQFEEKGRGLLIGCEGNYMAANASLSYYDVEKGAMENEVFMRANGQLLGDTAQSITEYDGRCWIVSNNSGVIFSIDPSTFKELGRITIPSPRYIHFLSPEKAYVTMLYDNRIAVINPQTYSITGYIQTPQEELSTASTEQMVQWGDYLFVNCWSYQREVLKIDTRSDKVIDRLDVGIQPAAIAMDANQKLWVLTDGGGWDGNPIGYEAPSIQRINPESMSVELKLEMALESSPSKMQCDSKGENLYWLNGGVWRMAVSSESLPEAALIENHFGYAYSMTIDPINSDIYVADAGDFMSAGEVVRYSKSGEELGRYDVGIIPSAFCWIER